MSQLSSCEKVSKFIISSIKHQKHPIIEHKTQRMFFDVLFIHKKRSIFSFLSPIDRVQSRDVVIFAQNLEKIQWSSGFLNYITTHKKIQPIDPWNIDLLGDIFRAFCNSLLMLRTSYSSFRKLSNNFCLWL